MWRDNGAALDQGRHVCDARSPKVARSVSGVDSQVPAFGVSGNPVDPGYHRHAGLSRELESLRSGNGIASHPMRGRPIGSRLLQLMPWSTLSLRLPQEFIGDVIALSGRSVSINDRRVSLGVPSVKALEPATALRSRLVTIKGFMDADEFAEAVRRQLAALEVGERCILTVGKRRTLRIKDKEVVGFEVILEGLLASESIAVQEAGIGGRRHMGCGVFVPSRANP